MARDYNSQASRRRNPSPPWLWFFTGILVGAVAASLGWMKQYGVVPPPPVAQQAVKPQSAPPAAPAEPVPEAPQPPRFDFYTLLPEQEVVIPEQEISRSSTPAPTVPASPPKPASAVVPEATGQSIFLLQMGSFRTLKDADRHKASLAMQGVSADIQTVTVSGPTGQNTVYRVRGGPYGRDQARSLHETLKSNKIDSIVIRIQQ